MRCDDMGGAGWGLEGGPRGTGYIHIYFQLFHVVVQQKLTQRSKTIILQLKQTKAMPYQKLDQV